MRESRCQIEQRRDVGVIKTWLSDLEAHVSFWQTLNSINSDSYLKEMGVHGSKIL